MKFLSIYKTAERGVPPTEQEMDTLTRLIEKHTKSGRLLATEGCLPSALGARVRLARGNLSVTDGPFTESRRWLAASPSSRRTRSRRPSSLQSSSSG